MTLAEVRAIDTPRANVRYASKDTDGNEYTTFRKDIEERAKQLQGQTGLVIMKQVGLDQLLPGYPSPDKALAGEPRERAQ